MHKLVNNYRFVLVEDHHHTGSGCYEVVVKLSEDISVVMPYLNSILDDTNYDHENKILIGSRNNQRYAFRPHEIHSGIVTDVSDAPRIASDIVSLVNHVWEKRDTITPSVKERKTPAVYEIFKVLPHANCRQCGCPTCLAFAAKLRDGEMRIEQCTLLAQPEYADNRKKVIALFTSRS